MKHFVVIGGGISGLSLAWFLKQRFQKSARITICEKSSEIGGWIRSSKESKFLFEKGPRGFRPKADGLSTLRLIEQLGIQSEVIASSPSSSGRYLWTNQKLQELPKSFLSFLFSPLTRRFILNLIRELFIPPQLHQGDESVYNFFLRRFGVEIASQLIDPLCSGIYAGDIKKLSMLSCFPYLKNLESTHHSVIWGILKEQLSKTSHGNYPKELLQAPLLSFKRGMQTLPQEIAKRIDAEIRLTEPVRAIDFHKNISYLHLNNETLQADHLFSTIPASALVPILPKHLTQASKLLSSLSYTSICTVNLGFTQTHLKQRGFGYLIPSQENETILGMTWDSEMFPQQNHTPNEMRLTVMIGGAHDDHFHERHENDFCQLALEALKRHLKIHDSPQYMQAHIHRNAIPQYLLYHQKNMHALQKLLNEKALRLSILGKDFNHCAINSCIASAEKFTKQFSLVEPK